jgi:hypothetical protein
VESIFFLIPTSYNKNMNYQKHYDALILRAKVRPTPDGYVERHHVNPRCLGGSDDSENIVLLTAREHYVAHQLLVKLNPEHHGLAYAAMLMTRIGSSHQRASNRYYAWLKSRFSRLQSEIMRAYTSENNPSRQPKVKQKRREAWLGSRNPSYNNPNWDSIRAAADAVRGKPLKPEHSEKIANAIKRWHADNPDKHPMKNPETLAKAVASRRQTYLKKKESS